LGIISGAFILYSLYYFDLVPDYLCSSGGDWFSCTKEEVCSTNWQFKVDYEPGSKSLHNWIEQYDLHCITPFQ